MRVFISWSGEPSRSVAQALRDWLPMVVQHVEPWMSDADIESGRRWNDEVAAELEKADYGIICLTASNIERPWLLFEAGALAKRFDTARVVPLLIDLGPADVAMPLASFQGRPLSQDGMLRLVRDMNAGRVQPLPAAQLDQLFEGMWPALSIRVTAAQARFAASPLIQAPREAEDVMAELVETVRRIERRMDAWSEADLSGLSRKALVDFSNELADAIAQLEAFWLSHVPSEGFTEWETITSRIQALIPAAQKLGMPVEGYFRDALAKWKERYPLEWAPA
jgi:hypothetical protein